MKTTLAFFTVWLNLLYISQFAFSQTKEDYTPFTSDSITVSGKVIGYDTKQNEHFITLLTHDLYGKEKKIFFQINNDGKFSVKIMQPFDGDLVLNYKNASVNLLAKSGSELKLKIHNNGNQKIDANSFIAYGDLAAVNNLGFRFQSEFDQQSFCKETNTGDKTQPDSVYSLRRRQQLNKELAFLVNFITNNNVTDPIFIQWQRNRLQYTAGCDILIFPFLGKMNKTITKETLLALIDSIPINNPLALRNADYYRFLNLLGLDMQIIMNINPIYQLTEKVIKYDAIGLCLDEYDKITTGITRELLYLNAYPSNINTVELKSLIWKRFYTGVKHNYLKKLIGQNKIATSGKFVPYNIVEKLKAQNVSENLKHRLIELFIKKRGTNLFLNLWGDWCVPCIKEMPHYPDLITALKGKSIEFLFLSAMTKKEGMLAVKKKYGIKADFINLTKDEVYIMENTLKFHGYPAHFIIDKMGNVIDNDPSNGTTLSKASEIERIIKK